MPVKMDAEANDGELGLSKRVSRRIRETDFVYQVRAPRERGASKKGMAKSRRAQELFCHRLVKIELDAAQALADFSRLAHMPSQCCPSSLKWSTKRLRSRRSYEACGAKLEPRDVHAPTDICPFANRQGSKLDSMTSLAYDDDKVSPSLDCQAESPSSPLPTSKLACGTFLHTGGHSSQSAFQRVALPEPMQKPSLASIKTEMEDLQSESLPPARQQQKSRKASVSLQLIKVEVLGKQEEDGTDSTGAGAKALVNLASQLVELSNEVSQAVLNRPKGVLSEEDKEARRLQRIQANRESARQTIRKKQFLCEELRRQAVRLTSENEGIKQRKEIMMQELTFLKAQNWLLKEELGIPRSSELEPAGTLQHSQGIPLRSLAWQDQSFPSHLMGWPRMTVQAGAPQCTDVPDKTASLEELSWNISNNQAMPLLSNAIIVPGIPVGSLSCVIGIAEQKCCHIPNDVSSLMPTNLLREENGAAGTETLKSSGGSCDADSATSNSQKVSENDTDIISLEEPGHVKERGALSCRKALVPFRGGSGVEEKHLKICEGFSVVLPVTCGSSASSMGCVPMSGFEFVAGLYGWRAMQRSATVAAEARKRRLELTRKKRSSVKKIKAG